MDIQNKDAMIAEIEQFKKEALKMHIVQVLADTYERSSLFDHNINADGSVIWFKTQARQLWSFWQAAKAQVPESNALLGAAVDAVQKLGSGDFVLVPKAESTGLTDKNEKLIFVGDVVEFVGGCRDFLDLSGVKSPLYTVNKGDKMIVRKLKSGYTLSLPWIDCDAPNRIGNLGNYDFWNLRRDFIVIEAQEQK